MPLSSSYPLLERIDNPEQLRRLSRSQLPQLADELRRFLLNTVSSTGGHLASNLGVVELTIALHYAYRTPHDRLIWDVGHQSYPHKILTGRRERMGSIRQRHGLAGFPKRDESPYDSFGVGHSSTSISAALGMALAAKHQGLDQHAVAIIGDGALTAGMAFEALNHAGDLDANLLVILNDNEMSISPNVGGLSNYLAKVLSSRLYANVKEGSKRALRNLPAMRELARRTEEHVKGMVVPGTLFEELGFNYIGPVDGHDLDTLVTTLKNLRDMKGPQLLHIVTQKGKGFAPAEQDPCVYHGVTPFDPITGERRNHSKTTTFTDIFSQWLCDMAAEDSRLVGITPAMCEGSGLADFSRRYPERYFDVGIAEQHAVTLAAGMACDGLKPVVAIYSSFLQRAYDQLIHDVALQNLPVLFAIDRGGLVGPDGPTHAGMFDLSFLRCVPNMVIMAPANEAECRRMLTTGFLHQGPSAVRYPRGGATGSLPDAELKPLMLGKAERCRQGEGVAILAFGTLLSTALDAANKINASVFNMRFIKPLDTALILELAASHHTLVTLEDNVVMGGAGSAVNELLASVDQRPRLINLGLPDRYVEHGQRGELLSECGLDVDSILQAIQLATHR